MAAVLALGTGVARSKPVDGRIAIIDTPDDTRAWAKDLHDGGVRIVARYFGRKCQPTDLPEKRIAFNGQPDSCGNEGGSIESDKLLESGLAILSVYQYRSSDPRKFLFGLSDTRAANRGKTRRQIARAEAEADAKAALQQSRWIGQKDDAPIYFGLDFHLRKTKYALDAHDKIIRDEKGKPVANAALVEACLDYFTTVKGIVGDRLGVYGDGYANRILREQKLVRYSWLSGSTGYEETAKFLRDGDWHLFQNQLDRAWFAAGRKCRQGLDIDTNVQNPAHNDIGAWNEAGLVSVEPERTKAIFEQRRPAKMKALVYSDKSSTAPLTDRTACKKGVRRSLSAVLRTQTVRVLSDDGTWLEVDVDDDGEPDGFCLKTKFADDLKHMPDY
jgi:hypothetical protein